ncbi:MAG: TonB-dependent receptor domain-containing protein [Candidatus Neomarinimicrobiota bacterium]
MYHSLARSGLIYLIFVLLPTSIYGQKGKIAGQVYDQDTGAPLAGANLTIERVWQAGKPLELEIKQGAAADPEGYYVLLNITPGTYDIKATMMGYTPLIKSQVQVNIDRTIVVDFPLQSTVLEIGAVEVVAETELIKADVSSTQEIIRSERIAQTPVLRVDEFVNKIKGVELVATSEGHGLSIRGGGIRETDVRIDGISIRDPRTDNSYLSLNSTSVQELQVLTGGFEAKYGGFRSGLVNVVTKEGSREKTSFSLKVDYTPRNQKKWFGDNPWSDSSWVYRVFADTSAAGYAWHGVPDEDTLVPPELTGFNGWMAPYREQRILNFEAIGLTVAPTKLTPEQKLKLWQIQHPQYTFANKPDMFIEGTLTGPLPGASLPVIGELLGKSTFMVGGKYENTQFAFPIGPINAYTDWNGQLKITSRLRPSLKLSSNIMYAEVNTLTAGQRSSFGGALMDISSRFNFLSNTYESVNQQAQILGQYGFEQMFNKSRLQFLTLRYLLGGVNLTHSISPRAYYTLDFQVTYSDNVIHPFSADPDNPESWVIVDTVRVDPTTLDTISVLNYPEIGTPNGSTNFLLDITGLFQLYGWLQAADSSTTRTVSLKGDLTVQAGRHHEIETGFHLRYNHMSVNAGTWLQSEKSWTPDIWQYYTATPVDLGAYLQDKLEFRGMIANIGVRAEYFNPHKGSYVVEHPLDQDYADFYNLTYEYLPGEFGSWERWVAFRDSLAAPNGWPAMKNRVQFKLSPRLGVSFPISASSKLYFNYGHFYQRPNINFLYNQSVFPGGAIVPSTDLTMERTVHYEFGYEQRFLRNYLFNITLFYKDIDNEPLNRTYVDWWEEMAVSRYYPDRYADIDGIELRLEKNIGRFITFWGNYEYLVKSRGQSGLSHVFENRTTAREEERSPNITTWDPLPRAIFSLNLHLPRKWGPGLGSFRPLAGILVNTTFEWRDGGKYVARRDAITGVETKVAVVDYSNTDLRASKAVDIGGVNTEIVLTVRNLFNQKRLYVGAMSTAQAERYKDSLKFPFEEGTEKGNDKWGEWDKEHIELGWFTAPLFPNPRQVLLGLRFNF